MKILNEKIKIEFKNNLNLSQDELANFAFSKAIELNKAIDVNNLILKLEFTPENIPDGFSVYCFAELSDSEKHKVGINEFTRHRCSYIDNAPKQNDKIKQSSFQIDLSKEIGIDNYIVNKISVLPKIENASFKCFVLEKD